MRAAGLLASGICIFLLWACPASADIYRWVDSEGVWHFTNVRSDNRYRLYIRTSRKSSTAYIRDYQGIIDQASKRFGLEPSLVKAVIKAESAFDSEAVSDKGAQGLMQLMPETASDLSVDDPFDPEENIFGGTRYLAMMMKRFNNNKRLAVAAYNAGPRAVENHKGIPPYKETQTFVKRVMSYYHQYNSR
ncbi:MAG: lytic transglycosylase domain-containing protein [Deltaproteobacteria bacterium]|nr:lytic transglycosylase domain-containing protein [Deltaproteobacteria bacterium]